MKKIKVLCVIDDDNIYQYTIKKTIEQNHFADKLITFSDGETAITFFTEVVANKQSEELPDVIFLDLNMPVMDGWDFLEEYLLLRPKIGKTILVYIVSSSIHEEDLQRAKAISEVTDYLVKPITNGDFAMVIKQLELQQ